MIDKDDKSTARVSVVIATTAEKKRAGQINNAINSVLEQEGCNFNLIVVINGNFPRALVYARSIIDSDYFCFLDDDDELLPGSLMSRFEALEVNLKADVAVGNGLKKHNASLELETHTDILAYQDAPLDALFRQNGNWLASCAGLFRSSTIPQEYFDDYAVYAEWTYLAFKLTIYKEVIFVDKLCYRINVNTESLSHNEAYLLGQYSMAEKVLLLPLPRWAKKSFLIKRRDMEHDLTERYLSTKQTKKAWGYHFKSLGSRSTFIKYFLFTRYLVRYSIFPSKNKK